MASLSSVWQQEPMLNLVAHWSEGGYRLVLFPRASHRPACYSAPEPERIAVSPAALEMAGVLVVSKPEQPARIDADAAIGIYSEVSLDEARFSRLLEAMG